MEKEGKTGATRRDFLKGAALLGAGIVGSGALAACSPTDSGAATGSTDSTGGTDSTAADNSTLSGSAQASGELTWLPQEPDITDDQVESEVTADVIVVGCGVSGTAAVRSAAEEGASVVAFEKADSPQGRSGDYAIINGDLEAQWGRNNFDTDMLVDHEMDEMSYYPKRAILDKWAKGCAEVFSWYIAAKPDLYICKDTFTPIPDANASLALYPWFYPLPEKYDWTKEKHPTYPSSVGFSPDQVPVIQANFDKAVAEGNVTPYFGHFVEKLIMEGDRVVGCYARNASTGKYVKATANKGLILSTGEYGSNSQMVDYYCPSIRINGIPGFFPNTDVEGNPTNMGDGLKLGAWVNAAIQDHHAPMVHWMGFPAVGTAPFLRLNRDGKRFMNEDMPGQQVENQIEGQPGRTIWGFWDSGWPDQVPYFPAQHGGICYVGDVPKNFQYMGSEGGFISQSMIDDAVTSGTIFKADTLDALFDLMPDIDKATGLASIDHYNQLAKAGKDDDFGKEPSRLFALENPPYYAASCGVSGMLVCLGGLESDEDCHVYDNNRKIIPGLYVSGNAQGNRYAVMYPIALKGVSHSLALFYGYVAGKSAANQV